jgi:CRP/FNR family transcriptional regulator, cyclic AMP receptor protein
VNRRAEVEIQALSNRLSLLTDKIEDVAELVRKGRDQGNEGPRL